MVVYLFHVIHCIITDFLFTVKKKCFSQFPWKIVEKIKFIFEKYSLVLFLFVSF